MNEGSTSAFATDWKSPIRSSIESQRNRGGFLVSLPAYRPDLLQDLAHDLGYRLYDYRTNVMAPLGWDAHRVTLDELHKALRELGDSATGTIVQNVEALLATKPAESVAQWMSRFLQDDFSAPVLIPLCVLTEFAADGRIRIIHVPETELPPQTFISRLMY